jgi:hypothetical protein
MGQGFLNNTGSMDWKANYSMNEKPILFSSPMIRALLGGRKTQTRRILNEQPKNGWEFESPPVFGRITSKHPKRGRYGVFIRSGVGTDFPVIDLIPCPYGQPGDQLWVRETFYAFGRWETRFNPKKGRDEWHFIDLTLESGKTYLYQSGDSQPQPMGGKRNSGGVTPTWWKRPAIFMPRRASRINLEVSHIRTERLQEISDADAMAEGVLAGDWEYVDGEGTETAKESYECLWDSINETDAWSTNPWVWVIEFEQVKP